MKLLFIFEPHHKKTGFLHTYAKTKAQISYAETAQLISPFCFCFINSRIPVLPKSKISSLQPSSMVVQTLSETPKTVFLVMQLIYPNWGDIQKRLLNFTWSLLKFSKVLGVLNHFNISSNEKHSKMPSKAFIHA